MVEPFSYPLNADPAPAAARNALATVAGATLLNFAKKVWEKVPPNRHSLLDWVYGYNALRGGSSYTNTYRPYTTPDYVKWNSKFKPYIRPSFKKNPLYIRKKYIRRSKYRMKKKRRKFYDKYKAKRGTYKKYNKYNKFLQNFKYWWEEELIENVGIQDVKEEHIEEEDIQESLKDHHINRKDQLCLNIEQNIDILDLWEK